MTLRTVLVACGFIASHVVCTSDANAVTIEVDASAPGDTVVPVWAYHGYDEPNYTVTREGRALLRTLAEIHSTDVHIRTHFLFNTGDGSPKLKWGSTNLYTEDDAGNPVYDYTLLDRIIDATLDSGAFPLFEFGFMPQALSTEPVPYENAGTYTLDGGCFHPPDDYDQWGALVAAWATHVKERYPDAESTWQWELWNEPDIGYWQGTFEEFARLYDTTEASLHAVLPTAPLGGPAVANPDSDFFGRFLQHCATGTNAVTGTTGTRLDMVSFHGKGGVNIADGHVQLDLGNQLRQHRTGFATVARSAFRTTPIVISEADPEGCAACPVSTAPHNAYRFSPAYGAYEVAMMKRTIDLAKEQEVDLRGVLTWAFTYPGSPYFMGYRALSTNGVHLPVLNAFKLLGSIEGKRLPVVSSGALPLETILEDGVRGPSDVDAFAAVDGDRIRTLVWNYHDDLVGAEPVSITLEVTMPEAFGTSALVTNTRVDDQNGNAYAVWESQGSPETPSAEQLAALRDAMHPVQLERRVVPIDGTTVSLSFDLPRFGLALVTLEPSKPETHETPAPNDPGCSCRLTRRANAPLPALLALALLLIGRRFGNWPKQAG